MTLPKGLEFLQYGWWFIHVVTIFLLWSFAYRKGRADEKRAQKAKEPHKGSP